MLSGLLLTACALPAWAAVPPAIKTVSHVHSAYSAHHAPDMLATLQLARQKGIAAVIFADDASATFEYGLRPLRNLIKKTVAFNSVLRAGPEVYLKNIASLRRRFPDMVIIPGVEAAPFYYWTGDPLKGLVMHNWNRHLSVAGLERAEDYRGLPVLGNPRAAVWRWSSLWPLALLALSLWAGRAGWRKAAWAWSAAGLIFIADAFPFHQPSWSPYDSTAGWKPYEALASYADRPDLLCFWNHPEASSWSTPQDVGLKVKAVTAPYPEALALVPQTDGFAALWEGHRTMTAPGGAWDQALRSYLKGARRKPPWAFGELDYGGASANGVGLDDVYMDVHASSRTMAGVLESLKKGRFESIAKDAGRTVELIEWSVSSAGACASSGETLPDASAPQVRIALAPVGAPALPATITLLRNGFVIFKETQTLPWSRTVPDDPEELKRFYYRLDVRFGPNGVLLSNPIFAQRP